MSAISFSPLNVQISKGFDTPVAGKYFLEKFAGNYGKGQGPAFTLSRSTFINMVFISRKATGDNVLEGVILSKPMLRWAVSTPVPVESYTMAIYPTKLPTLIALNKGIIIRLVPELNLKSSFVQLGARKTTAQSLLVSVTG